MPSTRRRDTALRDTMDRINLELGNEWSFSKVNGVFTKATAALTTSTIVAIFERGPSNHGLLELSCLYQENDEGGLSPTVMDPIANTQPELNDFLEQVIDQRSPRLIDIKGITTLWPGLLPIGIQQCLFIPLSRAHHTYGALCLGSTGHPYSLGLAQRLWPLTMLLATKRLYNSARVPLLKESLKSNESTGLGDLYLKLERNLDTALIEINANHKITRFNQGASNIFGYANREIIDCNISNIIPENYPNEHKIHTFSRILLLQQQCLTSTISGKSASGNTIPLKLKIIQYHRHHQIMSLLIIEDQSEINDIREKQREQIQRFKAVADLAPVGILQTNSNWEAIYVNRRWCDICKVTDQSVLGLGWINTFYHDDVAQFLQRLRDAVHQGQEFSGECRFYSQLGDIIWVELHARPMVNAQGELDGFLATLADCTYRRTTEEKLRIIAEKDTLTNLANRTLFFERLDHALQKTNRHGALALLCLDLDGFKTVNDTLGHDAGDRLLQAVARRIASCVRQEDTVARLGGDEFSILLEFIQSASIAADIATKILRVLERPFILQTQEVFISTSIGITFSASGESLTIDTNAKLGDQEIQTSPEKPMNLPGIDSATLMKQADIALYRAKAVGRNNFQYFSPELEAASQLRMFIGNSLHRALERQEFEVYYQLQADLRNQKIVGSEALLRWRHPQRGMLPPSDFIEILEETGLILPVSRWLWSQVFHQHKAWVQEGLIGTDGHISVNLSPRQLRDDQLVQTLLREIALAGLMPAQVLVEITETALIDDSPLTMSILNELRAAGVKIALDDFGTGFSSLTYLKRFPIHFVKIDQSFIRDLLTDAEDAAITHAVVTLAHTLDLTVIAEGVDEPLKRDKLANWGCDQFQGYILNVPSDSIQVRALLKEHLQALTPDS